MNYKLTKKQAKEMLENKLLHYFGVSTENATNEQYYKAITMIVRDMMAQGREIEKAIEFGCSYFVAGINDEEEKLFAERVEKAASYYADGEITMIGIEDFKSVDEMKKFFIEIADYEIYSYEEI